MKKKRNTTLLLLAAFILLPSGEISGSEQKNIILQEETTNPWANYTAEESIRLQPGFHYQAKSGQLWGKSTFVGKIDQGLLFPPTEGEYAASDGSFAASPSDGAIVGSIGGEMSVSPSGSAVYTIPIECPDGINGLKPNVSLMYNSGSGDGIAGWGWQIGGLSSVIRVGKTPYIDDERTGIEFTVSDALSLDGQRLIKITDYGDSAEYKTEAENFSRIMGYEKHPWGFKYFIVFTKEGHRIRYGSNQENASKASYFPLVKADFKNNGIHIFRHLAWLLEEIVDANGNAVQFFYTVSEQTTDNVILSAKNYQDCRLDRIVYGTNTMIGIQGEQVIQFIYRDKNSSTKYVSGEPVVISKLLDRIEVKSNGQNYRTYQLTYDMESEKYRLRSLTLAAENEHVNTMLFEWNDMQYGCHFNGVKQYPLSSMMQTYFNDGYTNVYRNSIHIGDIDNDGLTDVFISYRMQKKSMTSFADPATVNIGVVYRNTGTSYEIKKDTIVPLSDAYFSDKDNDGRDELYVGSAGDKSYTSVCYKFDSNGNFVVKNTESYSFPDLTGFVYPIIGDFRGNGTAQTIFISRHRGNVKVAYSPEDNFDLSQIQSYASVPVIYAADMNGNGKSDLICVCRDRVSVYELNGRTFMPIFQDAQFGFTYTDKLEFGDFNGDGNADIIASGSSGIKFYLSTGLKYQEVNMPSGLNSNSNFVLTDADKDGLTDIVTWYENNNGYNIQLLINKANCFEVVSSGTYSEPFSVLYEGMINRRDRSDICLLVRNAALSEPSISFTRGNVSHVLSSVTDGFGNKTVIQYTPFHSSGFVSTSFKSAINESDIQSYSKLDRGHWHVVESIKMYDSQNETASKQSYAFSNAYVHRQGKGFLGYERMSCTDSLQGIITTKTNQLHLGHYFLIPTNETIKTIGGTPIRHTDNAFTVTSLTDNRYMMLPTRIMENDDLTGLYSVTTYANYANGNPGKVIIRQGDCSEIKEIGYGIAGSWCPNKPVYMSVKRKQGNVLSPTHFNYYSYDTRGNLTYESKDAGDANQVTTRYQDINPFGQAQTISVTANGKTRITRCTYTPSGRYIASKTNILGETTTYVWNEAKGLLLSQTDAYGRTTTHTYTGWGNLKETKYPDGIRYTEKLLWAARGNDMGAAYYEYKETSGQSPKYIYYDSMGKEICSQSYGRNGRLVSVFTEYNTAGQKYRVSEPTFSSVADTWAATYSYDSFGRPIRVVTPMGNTTTSYTGMSITVNSPDGVTTTLKNTSGQTETVTTNGQSVSYTYHPDGNVASAMPAGGEPITMEYDLQGNRIRLTDPDAGVVESHYNGFGDLLWERQKVHTDTWITTSHQYADNGELQQIVRGDETTSYLYDDHHRVSSIEIAGKHKQSFCYDDKDQIVELKEEFDGKTFKQKTEYDFFGNVKKEIYPSGYYILKNYDAYGFLTQVSDSRNRDILRIEEENASGQIVRNIRAGRETSYTYDSRHLPIRIFSSDIIDMSYVFDANGNLQSRTDALSNQRESFSYDALQRLTGWNTYRNDSLRRSASLQFDATGNIVSKSDLGGFTMRYGDNGRPHALTSIDSLPPDFPHGNLHLQYTDFKKLKLMYNETGDSYVIDYGVDDQRRKSILQSSNEIVETRYYFGNYEETCDVHGHVKKIHYLSGGAMLVIDEAGERMYYGYRDYQGSLLAMAGADGIVCERYAYDPWGKRVKSNDWIVTDTRSGFLTNRGYTGHEHIDWGDQTLINMNGRVYDPYTAMFCSPDPFIQAPDNWVNYNRYAYCMNNPFKYTDPSGEFWHLIIGAVMGGVSNWAINGAELSWNGLGHFGIGALSGVAGAGVGGVVGGALASAGIGGFVAGGLTGLSSGASIGLINGFGTSLLSGADIGTAALSGLKQMGIGAVTGFAVGGILQGVQSAFQGKSFLTGSEKLTKITTETKVSNVSSQQEVQGEVAGKGGGERVKYIGRLEDLKGIPRNQTLLDDLPNLGSPKANYYQNMSVLRKALRDGYTIKDASWFRPNSELAPTLLNPNRTVGQTFLGAERLLLKNRGLWP